MRVSLRRLLADVLEDQLSIDATLPRTLAALVFRPGFVTVEYLRGRIASYVAPFRLYIATSLVFFLILSVRGRYEDIANLSTPSDTTVGEQVDSLRAVVAETAGAPVPPGEDRTGESASSRPRSGLYVTMDEDGLDANTGNAALDRLIEDRYKVFSAMEPDEATRAIIVELLDRIPTAMFVLLPVFAFLLKVFYLRKRRFYVEHFVFALHVHAFAFLLFTVMMPMPQSVRAFLPLLLALYLWLALKRVYQQGFFMTTVKFGAIAVSYVVLLGFAMIATLLVALLSV